MKALYLPNGPKNIAGLFPSLALAQVSEYYLQLTDNTDQVIATTPWNVINSCGEDTVRIHFLNAVGSIDAMNFRRITVEHETKSETFEVPLKFPLNKPDHVISRYNVRGTDTWTVKSVEYGEDAMAWIDELLDSPVAWMEWKGTQGQPDSYIPIVITDQKSQKVKENDRYIYEVTLVIKTSHERFITRN